MKQQVVTKPARRRLKVLGASALLVLLAACGEHPPKEDDEDDDPPAPPAAITIVAGSATESGSRDATGASARFNTPRGIAVDASGNLYVADQANATIRRIAPSGAVTTLAGAAGLKESVNGIGNSARFTSPAALALDSNNVLHVADAIAIRRVGLNGQVDTLFTLPIGNNVSNNSLNHVYAGGIAVDRNGNVYVTNGYGTRRIGSAGNNVVMLEGTSTQNNLSGNREFEPRGVAADRDNNVYVADLTKTISRVNGNGLTRFVGTANATGSTDGTGSAASFERVVAMTTDPDGNLYVADGVNNLIRKITPGGAVTTIAGTVRGTTLKTGPLAGSSFADIRGLTTDGKGALYATSGHAVIKIVLP
ncbi:MAG: SBBP repeat-containing protein [Janthinobacterium lividum]